MNKNIVRINLYMRNWIYCLEVINWNYEDNLSSAYKYKEKEKILKYLHDEIKNTDL